MVFTLSRILPGPTVNMHSNQRQMRAQSRPSCPLCQSGGQPLYADLPDGLYANAGSWAMKRCQNANCGLLWLDPSPLPEDLHLAYDRYFTHSDEAQNPLAAKARAFAYGLYRLANTPAWALVGLTSAKQQASRMYLHDLKPGRLLDVGCGDGLFLSRMRDLGWKVDGVDFDAKAIESARIKFNLDLKVGRLQDAGFAPGSFDAITLSHVVEHVHDFVALLRELFRLVRPGGRMVVTTPNAESLGHNLFGPAWFGLDPPRHVQVFTMAALDASARKAGFTNTRVFTSAANADIFYGGSSAIRDRGGASAASQAHGIRPARALRSALFQYREAAALSNRHNVGEELVLIAARQNS